MLPSVCRLSGGKLCAASSRVNEMTFLFSATAGRLVLKTIYFLERAFLLRTILLRRTRMIGRSGAREVVCRTGIGTGYVDENGFSIRYVWNRSWRIIFRRAGPLP